MLRRNNRGLTEEVVKRSAGGAHSDAAFDFVEKEDGYSAADWSIYDATSAGATMSAVVDTARHPYTAGGAPTGYVIRLHSEATGNGFAAGDHDWESFNPNAAAWNDTRRALSFWYRGGFAPAYVCISTTAGPRMILYSTGAGTDYIDGDGNARVYLGWAAGSSAAGDWRRFDTAARAAVCGEFR